MDWLKRCVVRCLSRITGRSRAWWQLTLPWLRFTKWHRANRTVRELTLRSLDVSTMSADENTYEVVLRAKTTVPGNTAWCVAAPHDGKGFFPSRLVIPDEVALNFFVIDVRVNRVSQLGSVGALPAELFGASGPGFDLMFDQVGQNDFMTIHVQSTRDEAAEFSAHVLVRRTLRSGVRKTCLGMGCTEVVAESAVNVSVMPQRVFRPTHLFLPSDVAPHFEVQKMFQCAQRGLLEHVIEPVPDLDGRGRTKGLGSAEARSRLIPIHLQPSETAEEGRFLTVSAVNRDGKARQFKAAIVGDLV